MRIRAALLNDWKNEHGEAGDGTIGTIPSGFRGADERERGAMRCAGDETRALSARSAAAVVAQVDHGVGQRLERIVKLTDAIEAKQPAPKPVFPAEHALDRTKPFFEDGRVE